MANISKMNPEIKKRWVDALRSGRYKQGQRVLKKNDGSFCCLGVLCDITKEELNLEWAAPPDTNFFVIGESNSSGFLPDEVVKHTGFPSISGRITTTISLASLNDDGMSFEEIAEVIEKHV